MKKLTLLGALSLSLFGCSQTLPVDIDEIEQDPGKRTATYIDENTEVEKEKENQKVSPDMHKDIVDLIKIKKEFARYLKSLDLNNRAHIKSEPDRIPYIRDLKYKLDSISFYPMTEVDDKMYDTMYNYQYNLSQAMKYMMKFLHQKDQYTLDIYQSYIDDMELYVASVIEFQKEYSIY